MLFMKKVKSYLKMYFFIKKKKQGKSSKWKNSHFFQTPCDHELRIMKSHTTTWSLVLVYDIVQQ